ncbi:MULTISPECIES: hypothetical protein [unclassified Erythrobacter]|uniref:hypothetical protein n=1 Tax=unclassified Erythrobacter TaxID=2633097 RepID=UPI0018D2DAD9|nr:MULTISPECIES: hypothetical protein [unclassified Erythrobacter]MBO9511094.1 hypothetical protein [Erythrobacter sp. A6_0]
MAQLRKIEGDGSQHRSRDGNGEESVWKSKGGEQNQGKSEARKGDARGIDDATQRGPLRQGRKQADAQNLQPQESVRTGCVNLENQIDVEIRLNARQHDDHDARKAGGGRIGVLALALDWRRHPVTKAQQYCQQKKSSDNLCRKSIRKTRCNAGERHQDRKIIDENDVAYGADALSAELDQVRVFTGESDHPVETLDDFHAVSSMEAQKYTKAS